MKRADYDAIIVGAGFAGIYQLYKFREFGLSAKVIDFAGDVGGVWYWNKYPGAMSDTHSYIYRFSWDKEDLRKYNGWKEHYVKQPDVLAYLRHVVDRHDLRKHMQFNTELLGAQFHDADQVWQVEMSTGETLTVRYLITALGLLSKPNIIKIKGIDTFQGELYHSARWPQHHDFRGKRVGVIGSGSTGVQIITAIAKNVGHLTCFQRHPQYSVPSGDGPMSKEERAEINANYDLIWDGVMNSLVAMGVKESTTPAMSVSEEQRDRVFQEAWQKGNGFRFMFETFSDITMDLQANEAAAAFIRSKIAEIVKDPEKRRKLTPHELYARRPLCDSGYYQVFNQDNVDIVHLQETPITEVTPKGIRTSDGVEHELDVLILATGFDAVDGYFKKMSIHGRNGASLKEHWKNGPTSYLGVFASGFPNMFMITGPNSPFTNTPPIIETQVELVTRIIQHTQNNAVVETTQEAEDGWTDLCRDLAKDSLLWKVDSWIWGANIPGIPITTMFFWGGLKNYRERVAEVVEKGFEGLRLSYRDGAGQEKERAQL